MKKILYSILILFYFSFPITAIVFIWCNGCPKCCDVPLLIYYTTQVVGAFATFSAVIVALFGTEIRNKFFEEDCSVSLVDNGLTEYLGYSKETSSPCAQHYDCMVHISNTGKSELVGCQILIKEVEYKIDPNSKYKTIQKYQSKALYWYQPEMYEHNIMVGDSYKLPLFKIYPANSCQTPDDSESARLKLRILGCGTKLKEKGIWKVKYQLRTKKKILENFEVIIEWNGEWYDRITEMRDSISVNYKKIKL